MAKFTITISDEAHPILKEWAKKDGRSLTAYLTVLLDNLTGVYPRQMYLPVDVRNVPGIFPRQQFIPHNTPENPTGQSHTPTNQI